MPTFFEQAAAEIVAECDQTQGILKLLLNDPALLEVARQRSHADELFLEESDATSDLRYFSGREMREWFDVLFGNKQEGSHLEKAVMIDFLRYVGAQLYPIVASLRRNQAIHLVPEVDAMVESLDQSHGHSDGRVWENYMKITWVVALNLVERMGEQLIVGSVSARDSRGNSTFLLKLRPGMDFSHIVYDDVDWTFLQLIGNAVIWE